MFIQSSGILELESFCQTTAVPIQNQVQAKNKVVGQNSNTSHQKIMKKTTVLLFAAAGISVQAASVAIVNNSFETPIVATDGTFVTAPGASGTSFNGWGWVKTTGSGFQD